MFRTAIKTLSLFRKVSIGTNSSISSSISSSSRQLKYNSYRIKSVEQSKLYSDTLNIFMVGALLNDSVNKTKRNEHIYNETIYDENCNNEGKTFKCQITGCEKRKNNSDCSCTDKCIVEKSELSIICDLIQ